MKGIVYFLTACENLECLKTDAFIVIHYSVQAVNANANGQSILIST